jgi:hypothetical protein
MEWKPFPQRPCLLIPRRRCLFLRCYEKEVSPRVRFALSGLRARGQELYPQAGRVHCKIPGRTLVRFPSKKLATLRKKMALESKKIALEPEKIALERKKLALEPKNVPPLQWDGPRVALASATDATTVPNPATGLLVYNTGTGALQTTGYLYWNGAEWRTLSGILNVPYTGGNGGTYAAQTYRSCRNRMRCWAVRREAPGLPRMRMTSS